MIIQCDRWIKIRFLTGESVEKLNYFLLPSSCCSYFNPLPYPVGSRKEESVLISDGKWFKKRYIVSKKYLQSSGNALLVPFACSVQ